MLSHIHKNSKNNLNLFLLKNKKANRSEQELSEINKLISDCAEHYSNLNKLLYSFECQMSNLK